MPITLTERPRFYEEQYLGAEDLTAAVEYGRLQNARHALGAHTWGIAMGLQLVEKESPLGTGQIDAFIQPGYAWDGFGRPLALLAPEKIPAELFSGFLFDSVLDNGSPEGRLIKVWLRYDEDAVRPPRPGFAGCGREGQFARVHEKFRIEVGERLPGEQWDTLSVAGRAVDARQAAAPDVIFDGSIPYQELPEEDERRRWLIPLGSLRWKPNPSALLPGKFIQRLDADKAQSERQRWYIGVVAGVVQAAGKNIRLRDRTKDYSSVHSDDLVWVEGKLRIDDDARLFGGQLDFRNSNGQNLELHIRRKGNDPNNARAVQVAIGPATQTTNRLAVGPLQPADAAGEQQMDEKFVVLSNGNVGVGTSAPSTPLHIVGSRLRLENSGKRLDMRTDGSAVDLQSDTDHLYLRASGPGGKNNIIINHAPSDGNVGIGTETPTNKLHLAGNTGIRQNRLYLSGGDGWSSLTYNAFHNAANNAWVFPDPTRKVMTIELDDSGGVPRFEVYSNLAADPGAWRSRFKIIGDTGDILMAHGGGNVGIGTTSPTLKLDIQGDFGRGNGAATLHLFGSRIGDIGDGVLFLRSGGAVVAFDGNDKVGIGLNTPACRLHVVDNLNAAAGNVNAHVAVVENTNSGSNADVLALKVGATGPGASNNFITFFGGNTAVGGIEGDGFGGVSFQSGGADFAECLPRLDSNERIEEGDIVGVFSGKISKQTEGAQHVAVISERPIVVGNLPSTGRKALTHKIAVVGQVQVKIRGTVRAGDLIVPSGDHDGVGIAMAPDRLAAGLHAPIVGRAWESSEAMELRTINAVVGFGVGVVEETLLSLLRDQQEKITALRMEVDRLTTRQTSEESGG